MCPGTLHYQQPGSPQVVSSNWILMRWWDPEQPGGGKSTVTPGSYQKEETSPCCRAQLGLSLLLSMFPYLPKIHCLPSACR